MNTEVNVVLTQITKFPRSIPLQLMTGDTLHYGYFSRDHLVKNKTARNMLVLYREDKIGRGIRTNWDKDNETELKILLPLPANTEEIHELFQLVHRAGEYWTGSVEINGNHFSLSRLDEKEEEVQRQNVRLLNELLPQVLGGSGNLSLSCAMHRLVLGSKEAGQIGYCRDAEAFGQWMHELQNKTYYIAEPEVRVQQNTGTYFLPAGVPIIFPDKPGIPFTMYDQKDKVRVDHWLISLYDSNTSKVLGTIRFDDLNVVLPRSKTKYYDAGHKMIEPLSTKDLLDMLELSHAKAQDNQ